MVRRTLILRSRCGACSARTVDDGDGKASRQRTAWGNFTHRGIRVKSSLPSARVDLTSSHVTRCAHCTEALGGRPGTDNALKCLPDNFAVCRRLTLPSVPSCLPACCVAVGWPSTEWGPGKGAPCSNRLTLGSGRACTLGVRTSITN